MVLDFDHIYLDFKVWAMGSVMIFDNFNQYGIKSYGEDP